MSFNNIQHISVSNCFDFNPYILFKLNHVWERNLHTEWKLYRISCRTSQVKSTGEMQKDALMILLVFHVSSSYLWVATKFSSFQKLLWLTGLFHSR